MSQNSVLLRTRPDGVYTRVVEKAGTVKYLTLDLKGEGARRYAMQTIGGSVKVSYTLQNLNVANNPQRQNEVDWVNEQTVAPGSIVEAEVKVFTCLKLEFDGDAEFFLMGV